MSGRCPEGPVVFRPMAVVVGVLVTVAGMVPATHARPRDTDGDGLGNRHERKRSHTNPRRADTDRDGLNDRFELRRSHTNPRRRDTDRDGLSDRFELRRSHTNPRRRDTDRDGLGDRAELRRFHTNPRRRDTDGDGASDGIEVMSGTNPLNPQSAPIPPSQPPPSGGPPPSTEFPTPASTGVPSGWQPSATHNGTLTVSQSGAVIDGLLVTGSIEVRATNVTIRNSRVYGRIYNQASGRVYNGMLVEDTEIGPDSGNNGQTAGSLGSAGYVARRVHIHNSTEGFRVGGYNYSGGQAGPVTIQDSFVDLDSRPGSCDHADGVQGYDEPPSMVIHHNTIDMRGVQCSTAPIYIGDSPGSKTVTNNLVMGGSYSLRLHNGASGITYPHVSGNRMVDDAWDYGPLQIDTCSVIQAWSDNRLVRIDAGYNITWVGSPSTRC
jgi:Bacterial TSP3 repeat